MFMVNVGKYTIHGWYGVCFEFADLSNFVTYLYPLENPEQMNPLCYYSMIIQNATYLVSFEHLHFEPQGLKIHDRLAFGRAIHVSPRENPGDVVLLFVEGRRTVQLPLAGEWVFPLIKHEMFESIKSWIGLYQRTPKEVKGPFIGSCWRFLGLKVLTCWKIELSESDSTRPKKRIFKSERIAKGTITTILEILFSLLFFVFSL